MYLARSGVIGRLLCRPGDHDFTARVRRSGTPRSGFVQHAFIMQLSLALSGRIALSGWFPGLKPDLKPVLSFPALSGQPLGQEPAQLPGLSGAQKLPVADKARQILPYSG